MDQVYKKGFESVPNGKWISNTSDMRFAYMHIFLVQGSKMHLYELLYDLCFFVLCSKSSNILTLHKLHDRVSFGC